MIFADLEFFCVRKKRGEASDWIEYDIGRTTFSTIWIPNCLGTMMHIFKKI